MAQINYQAVQPAVPWDEDPVSVAEWADKYIQYQIDSWTSVPELAEYWQDMDTPEAEMRVHDWTVVWGRLDRLRYWAAQGWLTANQMARYREVEALASRYEPVLRRLFREGPGKQEQMEPSQAPS